MLGWGPPGSTPVVADWVGDGDDDVAVFIDGTWFVDFNGDGIFQAVAEVNGWSDAGWTPVARAWKWRLEAGDSQVSLSPQPTA